MLFEMKNFTKVLVFHAEHANDTIFEVNKAAQERSTDSLFCVFTNSLKL